MTTIYRPAGYGPSPTQEEHTAAPRHAGGDFCSWLVHNPKVSTTTAPEIAMTWVEGGVVLTDVDKREQPEPSRTGEARVAFGGSWGVDITYLSVEAVAARHPDLRWCLLDPATGLPCAIGEPSVPGLEWRDGKADAGCVRLEAYQSIPDHAWRWAARWYADDVGKGIGRGPAPDELAARAAAVACARQHASEQVARWQETQRVLGGA